MPMTWDRFWKEVYEEQDVKPEGPSGWIQWKGTNVCMDVHCECGYDSHIDADFAYYFRYDQEVFAEGRHPFEMDNTEDAPPIQIYDPLANLSEEDKAKVQAQIDAIAEHIKASLKPLITGWPVEPVKVSIDMPSAGEL